MLAHRHTVPGLGAAARTSAPSPTGASHHPVDDVGRDRDHGRLDLPFLVRRQRRDTARAVGLADRCVIAPGYRADINVVDFAQLQVRRPEVRYDLPAGGRRLLQRTDGYLNTFVSGVETYANGEATGELPGRLMRGATGARLRHRDGETLVTVGRDLVAALPVAGHATDIRQEHALLAGDVGTEVPRTRLRE